jgi:hypothetical protein
MLVTLQVEEKDRPAMEAIYDLLKTLKFANLTLVVKNGEVLDVIKEERVRLTDLTRDRP